MTSKTTTGHRNLGKKPGLMLRLEKYGILPKGNPEGPFAGCSKEWSEKNEPPYDQAMYRAMAERLPDGWEDVTPEELDRMIRELRTKLEKKRKEPFNQENLGNRYLLSRLITLTLLAIGIGAALVDKSKFALMPSREDGELKAAERFSYILLLQLVKESNAVREILRAFGASTGLNPGNQDAVIAEVELFGILIAIKIASMKDISYGIALIEQFQEEITHGIDRANSILNQARQNEKLTGSISNGVALFLQQGKIAIEKGDFEGFYETYQGALGILGITDEQFSRDLESIRGFAARLVYACTEGRDDQTNRITGISQA